MMRLGRDSIFGIWHLLAADNDGLVPIRVLSGPGRGLRLRLNLLSGLETGYLYGTYEREVVSRLPDFVRPGMAVWDCGCYLGYYTAIFSRLVGPSGKVAAVEPDPANMKRIRLHAAINGLDNIVFVPTALGTGERVNFVVSGNTNSHISGSWIGATESGYADREVFKSAVDMKSESLDSLLELPNVPKPDVVKIDIEGFEHIAIKHAKKLMTEVRPTIVLELHNPLCDEAAWEFSQKWNCRIRSIATGEELTRRTDVHGTVLLTPR